MIYESTNHVSGQMRGPFTAYIATQEPRDRVRFWISFIGILILSLKASHNRKKRGWTPVLKKD